MSLAVLFPSSHFRIPRPKKNPEGFKDCVQLQRVNKNQLIFVIQAGLAVRFKLTKQTEDTLLRSGRGKFYFENTLKDSDKRSLCQKQGNGQLRD